MIPLDILYYYYYQIVKYGGNRSTTAYSAMLVILTVAITTSTAAFISINEALYLKVATESSIIITEFLLLSALTAYFISNKRYLKIIDKYDKLNYKKNKLGYILAVVIFFGSMVWAFYEAHVY